jgi:tetratricopeptide (TPR) repeat protein
MKVPARAYRRLLVAAGMLAAAAASPGCTREDPADLEYRAQVNAAGGRLEDAEANLARLARSRPLTVPTRLLRAQVARDRGRLDEALAALDGPREPKRGYEAALLAARRGMLEMERRRFRAAEAQLTRAPDLDPNQAEPRRKLIDLYALQGRPADIATQARALAEAGTLDFFTLYAWTLGQREGLDPAERAGWLEGALANDPEDRTSRLALADCLRGLGRLDQADAALDPLPGTDPEARATRARILLDRGDAGGAEALLESGPGTPDHPALSRLRGQLALMRGDVPAAVRDFRLAVEARPDDRDARFGLGQALSLAGEPEAARPHLQAARDHDRLGWLVRGARPRNRRNDPATLREIGAACLALGRRDLALAWYRLGLSIAPDNAELRAAISRVEAGPPSATAPATDR